MVAIDDQRKDQHSQRANRIAYSTNFAAVIALPCSPPPPPIFTISHHVSVIFRATIIIIIIFPHALARDCTSAIHCVLAYIGTPVFTEHMMRELLEWVRKESAPERDEETGNLYGYVNCARLYLWRIIVLARLLGKQPLKFLCTKYKIDHPVEPVHEAKSTDRTGACEYNKRVDRM